MPNEYRSITGLYKKYWTNEPLANATIIIRLLTNSFTLEAGYPTSKTPGVANDPGRSFQTDTDGNLPDGLELFCSGKNVGGGTKYRVTESDGFEWDFILDYGDGTPISMQTLRAGGLPASDSVTVIALIENKINTSCVRYDVIQNLDNDQQTQAEENIGGPFGGGQNGSAVNSVNGQTGSVVLNADHISDSATTKKFTTTAEKTAWNAKDTDAITAIRNGVPTAGNDLNKLYNLISAVSAIVGGSTADGDSVINTVAELLAVFATYPEGVNVVTALADKVNIADVANVLTTTAAGKVLDARQGKTLKDLIDSLTTTVSSNTAAVAAKVGKVSGSPVAVSNLWSGSQAQYDAISTPDANTIYFIV